MLSGSISVKEHAISDPSDLAFAIMLGVHYQLLPALGQCFLRVGELIQMLRNNVVYVLIRYLFMLRRQKNQQLRSHLQIEGKELLYANAGSCSRVLLVVDWVLWVFYLMGGPVEMEVVVDSKYFRDASFIEHFMDPLGDHGEQFILVTVPEPEDNGVAGAQVVGKLLVVLADLALILDHPLQKEADLLLVVLVHLLSNHTIIFLQQLVFLLLA